MNNKEYPAYQEYEAKNHLNEDEHRLMIFVEKLDIGLEYLKKSKFNNITIRTHKLGGSKQTIDLSFLKDFQHCVSLDIGVPLSKKTDISPIYHLENLIELSAINNFKVDVSFFPNLKMLYVDDLINSIENHESLSKLVRLYCSPKSKDLKQLEKLRNLEHIRMLSPRIENMSGIEKLPLLKELVVRNASKLCNIKHLAISKSIEEVLIENTRSLSDFSDFSKNGSIKELILATNIDSVNFVPKMKALEYISGNIIRDGNLQPLLDSQSLKNVDFYPQKKHYNLQLSEINSILKNR